MATNTERVLGSLLGETLHRVLQRKLFSAKMRATRAMNLLRQVCSEAAVCQISKAVAVALTASCFMLRYAIDQIKINYAGISQGGMGAYNN